MTLVIGAWAIGLPLLSIVNEWLPFSGGGDDLAYYRLAARPIVSWQDVFDFGRFHSSMAQPGYPLFLSLVNHLSGHDLYVFKSTNLLFLILLTLVWYQLGVLLAGKTYARKVACVVLCCTPLWYYVFFLFKDLVITLLQSVFLLGLVEFQVKKNTRSWLVMVGATVAVIFFRAPLALLNVGLIAAGSILPLAVRKKNIKSLIHILFVAGFVALIITILSNPHYMNKLGIYSESRMIGSEGGMVEMARGLYSATSMNRLFFPVLYIFCEISGFNPETWSNIDAFGLRGITVLPWVIVGIPSFMLGANELLFQSRKLMTDPVSGKAFFRKILFSKWLAENPWPLLFMFILCYFFISWQVGDTTRWRLPDLPVLSAVALYGWCFAPKKLGNYTIFFWLCAISVLFPFFYLGR